jgi:hypothetical protein
MGKSLLTAIAGAALIVSGGLASAQRMENSPGGAGNAPQGWSQHQPGMTQKQYPSESQPGAM